MPIALTALAALLVANVLLGPLGLGWLVWRVSPIGLNQTYGADAVSLLVVAPAALAAARQWARGGRLAAPLTLGVGLATLYYAVAETLGPDYLRYPGNNERYFLLVLALIVLSWTTAARAWAALDPEPPRPGRRFRRALGAVLALGGAVIAAAWLRQLVDLAVTGGLTAPSDAAAYADASSAFWVVRVVDLGFIAPLCIWAGIGVWRGDARALRATFGVASFLVIQATSVLAMGVVMLWRGDPTATPGLVVALAPISLALAALTARLLAAYGRDGGRGNNQSASGARPDPGARLSAGRTKGLMA